MSKQPIAREAILRIALAASLAAAAAPAGAEDFKDNLLFPWEAHGKVYEVGPRTIMFVGEIDGTLYAESAKGFFDTAFAVCPMLYEIDVAAGLTRSEGRCAIYPKGGEGVVYATYSCQGQIGACAGRLDLTGGTDKYEGIRGTGPTLSRTGAGELAARLGHGGSITNAEGLMTLTGFAGKTS